MDDLISRQTAIDAVLSIGHIAKLTDGDAVIRMSAVNYVLRNLPSAEPELATNLQQSCNQLATDTISRQAAINALWKALFEYEDKTEKQFQETDDLDIGEWMVHRIFVQNMSDIDRQTILELPSVQPRKGKWLRYGEDGYPNEEDTVFWQCDQCLEQYTGRTTRIPNFCPNCGADMRDNG